MTGTIFCDGACSGNGTKNAVGGWAWAYWPGAVMEYLEPTRSGAARLETGPGHPATNQRAELKALLEALRSWIKHNGGSVTIYTDSMYTINCTSKWGPGWKRKGWKRDSGEPLQNLDLIKPLVEIWRPIWKLEHVRGHQVGGGWQAYGNNWVDRAAVAAAVAVAVAVASHVRQASSSNSSINIDIIEHIEEEIEIEAEPRAEPRAEPKAEPRAEPKAEPRAEPKAEPRAQGPAKKQTKQGPHVQTDLRSWFSP